MINKKQYTRLTAILLIPLIFAGIWLAGEEKIIPWSNTITCIDRNLVISCDSQITSRKQNFELLHKIGAIRLQNTEYIGDLNYYVTASPPIGSGDTKKYEMVKLGEFLLSQQWIYKTNNSCGISYFDLENQWLYDCDSITGKFKFHDENVDEKFKEALNEIKKIRETRAIHKWTLITASLMIPLTIYFLISALFLLLNYIVRFVIHGRFKQ